MLFRKLDVQLTRCTSAVPVQVRVDRRRPDQEDHRALPQGHEGRRSFQVRHRGGHSRRWNVENAQSAGN